MTNILLTGASRGIGAATLQQLRASGATVAGQSTLGHDGLIAADLSRSGAADRLWEEALDRLGGRIDVLINNAGGVRRRRGRCGRRRVAGDVGAQHRDQPAGPRGFVPPRGAAFPGRRRRPHRQYRQPCRPPRRFAFPLALRRRQGRTDRHDQDHRACLCGTEYSRVCSRAGLRHDRHGRRISRQPRRRKIARRHPARPRRNAGRSRRDDPLGWRSTHRLR